MKILMKNIGSFKTHGDLHGEKKDFSE